MESRRLTNLNAALRAKYVSFWAQTLDPNFYAPFDDASMRRPSTPADALETSSADVSAADNLLSYWNLFKTEILNSYFLEQSASFWAVDGTPEEPNPIACLVAAVAPNDDALDGSDATLLAPLFSAEVDDADKATAAQILIERAENALRKKGVRRVYAGGAPPRTDAEGYAPIGAPLLNGVYGVGSPVGFFNDDAARKFFVDAGYEAERNADGGVRAFVERKIDANSFFGNADELPSGWRLTREDWSAPSWRHALIARNFSNARRFCVRGLDASLLAIAWVYDLVRRSPKNGALSVQTVVSRLSVRPQFRGQGLGKALVAELVDDATTRAAKTAPGASLEICVVVPDGNAVARDFWDAQGFGVGRRSTPLVKTLES